MKAQGVPVRCLHRNNFQRKDFVWHQWSRTLEQRIHHPQTGASSGAVRLLSGFSRLENSARKGDGRDGGSLRFLNPCCDQVLFAVAVPTMTDRAMQTLYKFALEPVAETTGDPNSYGFRMGRCTQDAAVQCAAILARKDRAQWVLEGDIKGCFDNISHDWIEKHIPMDKEILHKFLKCGYIDTGKLFPTHAGTPQGGLCRARHNPPYDEINVMSSCH